MPKPESNEEALALKANIKHAYVYGYRIGQGQFEYPSTPDDLHSLFPQCDLAAIEDWMSFEHWSIDKQRSIHEGWVKVSHYVKKLLKTDPEDRPKTAKLLREFLWLCIDKTWEDMQRNGESLDKHDLFKYLELLVKLTPTMEAAVDSLSGQDKYVEMIRYISIKEVSGGGTEPSNALQGG